MSEESLLNAEEAATGSLAGARVIKRYANRKMYDQQDSCYVSLSDIEQLICSGKNVVVVENDTGREVTGVTLAQIIIEQQKRGGVTESRKGNRVGVRSNVAPVAFLTRLIRSSEDVLPQLRLGLPKKNNSGKHSNDNVLWGQVDPIAGPATPRANVTARGAWKVLQSGIVDWKDKIEHAIKVLRSGAGADVAIDEELRGIRQQIRDIELKVESIASRGNAPE